MRIRFQIGLKHTAVGEVIDRDGDVLTVRITKGRLKGLLTEIMQSQIRAYI